MDFPSPSRPRVVSTSSVVESRIVITTFFITDVLVKNWNKNLEHGEGGNFNPIYFRFCFYTENVGRLDWQELNQQQTNGHNIFTFIYENINHRACKKVFINENERNNIISVESHWLCLWEFERLENFFCNSRKYFWNSSWNGFFRKFYDAYTSAEWNPNELLIVCKFTVWRTRENFTKRWKLNLLAELGSIAPCRLHFHYDVLFFWVAAA